MSPTSYLAALPRDKTGGGGWIRTIVGFRQQIYSLPPLATRAPLRSPQLAVGLEPTTCGLQIRCATDCATPAQASSYHIATWPNKAAREISLAVSSLVPAWRNPDPTTSVAPGTDTRARDFRTAFHTDTSHRRHGAPAVKNASSGTLEHRGRRPWAANRFDHPQEVPSGWIAPPPTPSGRGSPPRPFAGDGAQRTAPSCA